MLQNTFDNEIDSVNFLAVGDVLLGGPVKSKIDKFGYDHMLGGVASTLNQGDLVFANLETSITVRGLPLKKRFRFRSKPEALAALRRAGINIVNLANNHTLDYGRLGLRDTLDHLKEYDIPYIGAGPNKKRAHKPLIITRNNLKVGFLGYAVFRFFGVSYKPEKASVAQVSKIIHFQENIANLRKHVDVLIVSFHWGREFYIQPNKLQRRLAHAAINAGADLVLGHHPHVLQPSEWYKGKLIVYSLGNFVFFNYGSKHTNIFKCQLTKEGVKNVEFIPVVIRDFRPEIANQ